jgi:hypothetical protein
MRHLRLVVVIALFVVAAACGSNPPTATPTPLPSHSPTPAAVASPSATLLPAPATVPPGVSLEIACNDGATGTIYEYLTSDATGYTDILLATAGLRGVQATDIVVHDGVTHTVVIRDGKAIWRGDWDRVPGGFMLGGSTSCQGVSIGY